MWCILAPHTYINVYMRTTYYNFLIVLVQFHFIFYILHMLQIIKFTLDVTASKLSKNSFSKKRMGDYKVLIPPFS